MSVARKLLIFGIVISFDKICLLGYFIVAKDKDFWPDIKHVAFLVQVLVSSYFNDTTDE